MHTLSYMSCRHLASKNRAFPAKFRLSDGSVFNGISFGASLKNNAISGETVFTTSLVGYPESMTDPSYCSQLLVFTQPLIGNYGVPQFTRDQYDLLKYYESEKIQVKGIIVGDYSLKYSHWNAVESLSSWCTRSGVVAITGVDTRAIVTTLREKGTMMGQIEDFSTSESIVIPNSIQENLVSKVSSQSIRILNSIGKFKIALVDCGAKNNIIRSLISRGAQVIIVPWDYNFHTDPKGINPDGIFLSNGPGNPTLVQETITNLKSFMDSQMKVETPIPIFGICMGNQLLGLAAGFKVEKMKFGNRGHNQPVIDLETGACYITSQNHGYVLQDADIPDGWKPFFRNANDFSNEGIKHKHMPWSSVQFHPEAKGGPLDTEYIFDNFVKDVQSAQLKRMNKEVGISSIDAIKDTESKNGRHAEVAGQLG